jgi:hypothetical protein
MNTLKLIGLTLCQLARQACLLPQAFATAVKQRRAQAATNEREAERRDRICNPAKYVGK